MDDNRKQQQIAAASDLGDTTKTPYYNTAPALPAADDVFLEWIYAQLVEVAVDVAPDTERRRQLYDVIQALEARREVNNG